MPKQKSSYSPLAFRLRPDERAQLKELAGKWQVKQVEVIRRLLRQAYENVKGADNERNG